MTLPVVSIGNAIFAGLWASVLDASIFACLVVAAIRLAKPGAATRHLMYWLVLTIAIGAPVASIAASLARVETIAEPTTRFVISPISSHTGTVTVTRPAQSAAVDAASGAPEINVTIPRSLLIASALGIWLSVALYKTIALCFELVALARVKRRAKALDRSRVAALHVWNAHAASLRTATIALSRDVDVPCAAGLWAPAILLPASVVAKQTADDIDRIVMHEAAHLARYDDWTNVFERVLAALLWFNPALAFARGRITVDREIACDDWAVARMGGAHGYASCLFRLAEATRSAGPTAHALGALGNARHITKRIEHLLSNPKLEPRRVARTVCATLGIAALALTIVQAAQAPAIAIDIPTPAAVPSVPTMPAETSAESAVPVVAPSAPQAPAAPKIPTAPAPHRTIIFVTPAVSAAREASLRAARARIDEAARKLANVARELAEKQAELARTRRTEQSDPSLSAMIEQVKKLKPPSFDKEYIRRASAEASQAQSEMAREIAKELASDLRDRDEAERDSKAGLRDAMRAQVEALRASAEAIRESNLGQAEVKRAMQEMRDELKREGLSPSR